jgi:hypothetical protein
MTDRENSSSLSLAAQIPFALVVFTAVLGYYAGQPPRPVPATASPDWFSAERALAHSQILSREPHPAGSEALEHGRDYLLAYLKHCGLEAEIQRETVIQEHSLSYVENVLARIPGTNNKGSFVLTAHYDSVYSGPGAADDGSGVITMLETARALMAGPRLQNDVVFAFTGDEERGMRGIQAFKQHPWARNVGVVLGLEGRGYHGPSYMFETSPRNYWLIQHLHKAGVNPRANSLMYEVHRRTPNATDYGAIKNDGFPGYNVSFVGGLCYYHSANDNPSHLSAASIQHHGSYALGLARYFGNMPLAELKKARQADSDAVYANLFGSWLVYYPARYSRPIAWLAGAAYVAAVAIGFRRRRLTLEEMAAGALGLLGAALAAGLVTGGLVWLAYQAHGVYILYRESLYVGGLAFLALAAAAAVFLPLSRRFGVGSLWAGALVWLVVGVGGLEWWAPVGSYLAAWPLICISLGMAVSFLLSATKLDSAARMIVMSLFALPVLLSIGPSTQALIYMGSVFIAPLCVVIAIVFGATVLPQLTFGLSRAGWRFPAISAFLGLLLVGIAWGTNGFSPAHPRENSVCYALDLDSHKASWASGDRSRDSWTAQFFKDNEKGTLENFFPGRQTRYFMAEAPLADIPGPQIDKLEDTVVSGTRTTRLRITSPRKVPEVELTLFGPERVLSVAVDGREIPGGKDKLTLHFEVFPRSGSVELVVKTTPGGELGVRVKETSYSLAEAPSFRPRPANMIRRPNTLDWFEGNDLNGDFIFVLRTFRLGRPGGSAS